MASFFNGAGSFVDGILHMFPSARNPVYYDEEAALRAAMQASVQDQQRGPQVRGAPPASRRALRSLPLVSIAQEDLVDPVNRECCICLEPHPLHTQALRLPCAHIFHRECVENWLQSSCTCPVCRYELPTDDPVYEAGRVQRMSQRKPRFARHELNRLPLKTLVNLRGSHDYQAVDRQDLIDYLIRSGSIELVAAPDPVHYSLSALRGMSVSQLRECMNEEAGVFFDPKDVIEKDDMIRIFVMSGRLMLIPEPQEDPMSDSDASDVKPPAIPSTGPIVETVTGESIKTENPQQRDERNNHDLIMEENESFDSESDNRVSVSIESTENTDTEDINMESDERTNDSATTTSPRVPCGRKRSLERVPSSTVNQASLETLTVHDLLRRGRELNIDLSDCIERHEMVRRLSSFSEHNSTNSASAPSNDIDEGDPISRSLMNNWSASQIRTVAQLVEVDLSNAVTSRHEMVQTLCQGIALRPAAIRLVRALVPFLDLSVAQLRAVARELQTDVSQCVEKNEMLRIIVETKLKP